MQDFIGLLIGLISMTLPIWVMALLLKDVPNIVR